MLLPFWLQTMPVQFWAQAKAAWEHCHPAGRAVKELQSVSRAKASSATSTLHETQGVHAEAPQTLEATAPAGQQKDRPWAELANGWQ